MQEKRLQIKFIIIIVIKKHFVLLLYCEYTFRRVFLGSTLSFYQYKNHQAEFYTLDIKVGGRADGVQLHIAVKFGNVILLVCHVIASC